MLETRLIALACLYTAAVPSLSAQSAPNPFAYLDEGSPFYVHSGFPRLTTPMWFGEDGVDAVVILSIDDLRKTEPYRVFLEPILARLKEIEERSPLSIFTCEVDPDDPQLARWLADGVRLDVHTRSHPCPLLRGTLEAAAADVLDCVTNLNRIPGNRPVAFRMPCCDSINSASPRFFSEILPLRTKEGQFLEADSSVLMFLDDSYRSYAPFKNYAATAQGYPYPYVVNKLIWEFPIICPSDWQAQNRQRPFDPQTVADIERGIDRVVEAQGTFTLCFHPHGWIRNTQVVEIIDHAVKKHGRGVRFVSFHDVLARMKDNLLGGMPLRAGDGSDNGVRLLDVNADGFLDVVIGNDLKRETRVWDPREARWATSPFPFRVVTRGKDGSPRETGVKFGVLQASGFASAIVASEDEKGLAHFDGSRWVLALDHPLGRLGVESGPLVTARNGRDSGVRLRDVDGDGFSELLVSDESQNAAFRWDKTAHGFKKLPLALPRPASISGSDGQDRGLRFWDVNGDGHDDAVLSNDDEYHVYLWAGPERGWARRVLHGPAGAAGALPKISSGGKDMGAWFKDGVMYVANEETSKLPDLVDIRRFDRMIEHMESLPVEPADAVKLFRVPEGFRVELFAAEPMVQDPVSIDFGPDGRIWVVEMGSYPLGQGADSGGRVKILRDRDGDGRVDSSAVFAGGFTFPTGALSFRRGVLVTCAPDILYLEDGDGNDRADERRVVFTGFGEGNQQHRVNGLHRGIDNWIYGANGDSGGEIRIASHPGSAPVLPPVRIGGRDFRFSRDLLQFEVESGRTQFGLAMDDLGNRFGASNARHILHAVLPERYLARNPHYAPPDPVLDIPEHGAMARIYPIAKELIRLNDIHVPGHFSSACGVTVYRGGQFPEEYRGNAFVCEPVANLVHRDVLVPDGATFRAERARSEQTAEFLASSDNWFRPVYCANGPDGALYVVDMYRYVIEHPAYIPQDLQQILDFAAGRDRGRIYRVVHADRRGTEQPRHRDITRETIPALVALLDHPNGWWRDAAQRLLVERRDPSAVPLLEEVCARAKNPTTRVHALWILEGQHGLHDGAVRQALADPDAAVREHSVRLAEGRFGSNPALLEQVLALRNDSSFRVRLQVALSLGEADGLAAGEALSGLLRRDIGERWMRAAVLSSSLLHAGHLLAWIFTGKERPSIDSVEWREVFEALLRTVTRKGDTAQLQDILEQARVPEDVQRWHILLLAALEEVGGAGGTAAAAPAAPAAPAGLRSVQIRARIVAHDLEKPAGERVEAIRALGVSLAGDSGGRLLEPREPAEVQVAVAGILARAFSRGVAEAADTLIDAWPQAGPLVRSEVLEGLLASAAGAEIVLAAVQEERIRPGEIDAASRARILERGGENMRERVARLLPEGSSEDRERVVARYQAALKSLPRDAPRGREVFRENCAPCHRLDGDGFEVGPDLAAGRSKGDDALLEAVLNPSRMVPPRYMPYAVETERGVATGIIESETASAIRLLRSGGVNETILRADIRRLVASGESLMPADLEKTIPPEAMADLLGFLAAAPKPLRSLDPAEMDQARKAVIAGSHGGLAEVLRWGGREPQLSWVGTVSMSYVRQLDGKGELEWRTEPVPADLDSNARHAFVFPAAMGYVSQPSGTFTLLLGGRELLDFEVSLASRTWKNKEGSVTFSFAARASNAEDATGLATLEVPARLLDPGKPAVLKVVGSNSGSRRWFGVLPLR